jgi:hypothetical protein
MNGQDAKDFHLKLPNSLTGIPDKLLIYNLSLLPYICSFNMIGQEECPGVHNLARDYTALDVSHLEENHFTG